MLPLTTETTGPNQCATNPDSRPPNSLEDPIKTLLTAETRPRIWSGVRSCTSVCRITTLMLSNAPVKNSMANESQNDLDSPKTIVARPNPATARSRLRPARRIGGRCASSSAIQNAPMAGAARSHPNPVAPTCKISSRSEEHTSELQSRQYLVCRLLL